MVPAYIVAIQLKTLIPDGMPTKNVNKEKALLQTETDTYK